MENKDIRYILDNIISKAKYNEEKNIYEIKEEDYMHLNLTTKQKKLLKEMCHKQGIKLEYTSYNRQLLPAIENEKSFQEYNTIKHAIEISKNDEEKNILEQKRIELRNKIFKDNIRFVDAIIERRINKINEQKNLEDIYQASYEILIEYIDKNYLYKGIFKDRISKILLLYTTRRILINNESIEENTKNHLKEINRAKETKEIIDIEEISKSLNLSKKRIEELLQIENIITCSSLEEHLSLTNSKVLDDTSIIQDDILENIMLNNQRKYVISKIILTLPKLEQEILVLYFGLNGKSYTQEEIAQMYGTTRSYISIVLNKALETIKTSIRINYLKELYPVPDTYEQQEQTSNRELEEFLIRNLPQKTIDFLKPYLDEKIFKLLEIYTKEPEYKLKELSIALNTSITQVYKLKEKMLTSIKHIISNQLNQNNIQKITYEEYLNYLMKLWMKNKYVKRKVR